MSRITYRSERGIYERAFLAPAQEIEEAAQAATATAGELAKTDARANILSAGLGAKFAKALRLNVYPKKGASLKAAAQIFHKIPYAGIFEEGATMLGKQARTSTSPAAGRQIVSNFAGLASNRPGGVSATGPGR